MLKEIKGWSSTKTEDAGRFKDDEGRWLCGFYVMECDEVGLVCFLNNGHQICNYEIRNVEIPFVSSSHNWENLFFCGGYKAMYDDGTWSDELDYQFMKSLNGEKPLSFIIAKEDAVCEINELSSDKLATCIKENFWEGYKGRVQGNWNSNWWREENK